MGGGLDGCLWSWCCVSCVDDGCEGVNDDVLKVLVLVSSESSRGRSVLPHAPHTTHTTHMTHMTHMTHKAAACCFPLNRPTCASTHDEALTLSMTMRV